MVLFSHDHREERREKRERRKRREKRERRERRERATAWESNAGVGVSVAKRWRREGQNEGQGMMCGGRTMGD